MLLISNKHVKLIILNEDPVVRMLQGWIQSYDPVVWMRSGLVSIGMTALQLIILTNMYITYLLSKMGDPK